MKKTYKRFTFTEISYHWVYAFTFMPLLATGLLMIIQKVFAVELVAKQQLITLHKYIGISFIVLPFLIALGGDWRIHLTNLIEALTWKKRDFLWLFKMTTQSKDIPAAGKFNPGQKINMLLSLFNYFAFAITGIIMWLQKGALGAWYIHIILFVLAIPMLLGHLFLATINRSTRPGFPGMINGKVPMSYVEHHHELVLTESRRLIELRGWWKIIVAIPVAIILFNVINILIHYQPIEKQLGDLETFNKKIVMPGELIAAHTQEVKNKNCYSCHDLAGNVSDEKCLACHEKIAVRIKEKKGHHAKFTNKCTSCHQDHHGKEFESRPLKFDEFNHEQALFSLAGAHKKVKCEECHRLQNKKTLTFIGIPFAKCKNCHETPHGKQFTIKNCDKCHQQNTWKNLSFVHNKDSRYPLVGKHQQQQCKTCHKKQGGIVHYQKIPFDRCDRCHDNPHKVKLQNNCNDCHNEHGWKGQFLNFSHSKTKFPLTGKHAEISCNKCHKSKKKKDFVAYKIKTSCNSCHKDQHQGQLGSDCAKCHSANGWKGPFVKFVHSKTKFPLKGAHIEVSCAKCHKSIVKKNNKLKLYKIKTSCNSCHKDQHQGQLGNNCMECHNQKGWDLAFVKFNHDKANFKLSGAHRNVSCEKCHKKNAGKTTIYKKIASQKCSDCHEDVHRGIKNSCTNCHNETGWSGKNLTFNHRNTKFPLNYDHKNVSCKQCHKQKNIFSLQDVSCKNCHQDYTDIIAGNWQQKAMIADHHHKIVSCKKCHNDKQKSSITQPEKICSSCHTTHYEKLYFEQKLFVNRFLRKKKRSNTSILNIQKIGSHNFAMLKRIALPQIKEEKE